MNELQNRRHQAYLSTMRNTDHQKAQRGNYDHRALLFAHVDRILELLKECRPTASADADAAMARLCDGLTSFVTEEKGGPRHVR